MKRRKKQSRASPRHEKSHGDTNVGYSWSAVFDSKEPCLSVVPPPTCMRIIYIESNFMIVNLPLLAILL